MGAISLVIWLLTIVICVKYVAVVLQADNEEQGGVFALLALLSRHRSRSLVGLTGLLILGAGMLLGDGVITPAISVLSAVEGLSVWSDRFSHYTVPITLLILVVLFALQSHGTRRIGQLFGPVLVWFAFLAATGIHSLAAAPEILAAFNPIHAVHFLDELSLHHLTLALGSVILVVTGGEALFADLGHMGKRPIRVSWFLIVYLALVLNYLGQGAQVLSGRPIIDENMFFRMVPGTGGYVPLIIGAVMVSVMLTWQWGRERVRLAFSQYSTMLMSEVLTIKNSPESSFVPPSHGFADRCYAFETRTRGSTATGDLLPPVRGATQRPHLVERQSIEGALRIGRTTHQGRRIPERGRPLAAFCTGFVRVPRDTQRRRGHRVAAHQRRHCQSA